MNKKIAIIGNGWVGKAMWELFPYATVYTRNEVRARASTDLDVNFTSSKEQINQCDVVFICVPTPSMHEDNPETYTAIQDGLDTSAVEECIAWCECPLIVIRSTVNPGDCGRWQTKYGKTIVFQPEYLGETPQHPLLDTVKTPFLIIGGDEVPYMNARDSRRELIELYITVYNAHVRIRQVSLLEAEIIKLSENRAIAFKVAQCQELYDVCEVAGVDYYTIRDAVYGDDPRFNLWWSFIYPEKRGFQSKCIPKDIYAWCAFAESVGYEPKITRAILEKNKEWINDKR